MPEITVTADQQERLEDVRQDVEAAFVDRYGQSTIEDALEYLLDTYTPPGKHERVVAYETIVAAEYPELQRIASEVDGVPGSGISAEEMRGQLLTAVGPVELAEKLSAVSDSDSESAVSETENHEAQRNETADGTDDETAESGQSGDPLATANQLLDEHDEKWSESTAGEEPYEVELPDGTVEPARTRDDVRRLLFRHY